MAVSWKSFGTAAPVLLVLALGCWLYMLWSMAAWIGKTPAPGRGEDKVMLQVFSAALAVGVWLLVGGLLVVAATRADMPAAVGIACWVLHPLSGLLALVGIAVAYDVEWRWAVAIPAVAPLLIAGYAVWLLAGRGPGATLGWGMWAAVMALGLAVIPAAIGFQRVHMPHSDAVEDKPGPELDAFQARELERRRQRGLEQLRQVDEDTQLVELESLVRDDSPVRKEALEAMRKMPNKQPEVEKALTYEYAWILRLLPDLEAEATPGLCQAARQYLLACVRDRRNADRSGPSDSMGLTLEQGIRGVEWIARHCECGKELDALDRLARDENDTPDVRKFRETLASFRKPQ